LPEHGGDGCIKSVQFADAEEEASKSKAAKAHLITGNIRLPPIN
jgi:hypothetical protein